MKLLLKFNLVFLLVFVVGLGVSGYIARTLLQREAQAEVLDRARLLMEKASVVSTYTANQIAPLLATQMQYTFLPQSVPAYSSTEILNALQKTYPDYSYKAAMLNPTNPRDRAVAWEEDVINQFGATRRATSSSASARRRPARRCTSPGRSSSPTERCLACHSTPDAAPKPLVDKYGPSNGFGWTLNETIGAQVVSVPMTLPLQRADRAFGVVMAMLAGVFLLIGVALNLMLWKLVIQPVSRLSALSDRVSMGELDAPEFVVTLEGRDRRARRIVRPHAQEPGACDEDARELTTGCRSTAAPDPWSIQRSSANIRSPPCSARARWASSIARTTRASAATSRSRPSTPSCWATRTIRSAADGMAARFRNEARAVGRLSHPGIVAIYEYGEDAGTRLHRDGIRRGQDAGAAARQRSAASRARGPAPDGPVAGCAGVCARARRLAPRYQARQPDRHRIGGRSR